MAPHLRFLQYKKPRDEVPKGKLLVTWVAVAFLAACAPLTKESGPGAEAPPSPAIPPQILEGAPKAAAPPPMAKPVPMSVDTALGKLVTVWFGTTRKPLDNPTATEVFGNLRDNRLHFGTVDVEVPKSHMRGSLGSSWRFALTGKDEPLTIQRVTEVAERDYWERVRALLAGIPNEEKRILLFLHGYNTTFSDAALRTAQIWADLELKGVPAFFSWPSEGATLKYIVDEASIDVSERHLRNYMQSLMSQTGAKRIDVIAHSMGNRALLRVISQEARLEAKARRIRLGQVFLVAPDVDLELFEQLADAYPLLSERTTLYVSRKDKAVLLSEKLHYYPRTGAPPPFARVNRIETIEVNAGDQGLLALGHSFFAEFIPVLDDILSLITTGKPGKERTALATNGSARDGDRAPDFLIGK